MSYYVNLYKVGRAYGGPEEGGWFYDYGEFEKQLGKFAGSDAEDQADVLAQSIREKIREGKTFEVCVAKNQMGMGPHDGADPNGEGDDLYLISGGQWGDESLSVHMELHEGKDFPEQRPYYG
tara:strand:- start:16 stop:381 length:366 start_codon:yes stop_codon:yes gene_type:complete